MTSKAGGSDSQRQWRRVLWAALLVLIGGCHRHGLDRRWSPREQRFFYPSPSAADALRELPADEYAVFAPLGIDRAQVTMSATESVTIGSDVAIKDPAPGQRNLALGLVTSLGSLAVGARSQLGAVYALGTSAPKLGEGAALTLYAKSVVPVEAAPADLPKRRMSNVPPAIEGYRWREATPSPAVVPARFIVPADRSPTPLPPGSYGALVVPPGEKVRLQPGTYFFDSLVVQPSGTLEIDNVSELVYIWVNETLVLDGEMHPFSRQPTTLLGYHGSRPPSISTTFRGTLVAPNATVVLPATAEPHAGAFFARAIRVADHALIEHRTFTGWQQLFQDASVACSICGISANAAMRRCCALSDRPGAAAGLDERTFPAGAGDDRTLRALDDHDKLETCLSRVMPTFFGCEDNALLVPDACEALGFGYRAPASCGEY
jgi:hypothetical protein